ncbi:MAG: NAD(P)H:quinone oxidoreductase, type IV [Candidatus Melainabacteria bacterium RIFOXYA12_FULL_32_12]|nr:MAG: NAD(P)H:quinone oxidoreductase, type IV [Candidatus Melainabacteria bacterium GWF2_32_7]OGI18039.1 MAG: NAD(P)H:quinone oxidoreductase, type IV [Candidatus Melainabacteria bacterium RIFOXYA2_FULL_32_9]OGI25981.1 MAG: NAD(P)H:quinone oxidoreductase, type IV [Candidatus Melainabacteria bacterium RIFOXYA12_FULL_32_12]
MKILVIYYSMYGNTFELAKHVVKGAKSVEGAEVGIKQVPDLLPREVIEANPRIQQAKEMQKDIPVAKVQELADYDAIIWGTPTRYGNMTAQMKNFIDQTGSLWNQGKLENKVTGVFTSTSSIHGGQETTILTSMVPLFHLGMIIVGVPYSVPELLSTDRGGTPYGPSHVAGEKSDQPVTNDEAKIAFVFGKRIAEITKRILT